MPILIGVTSCSDSGDTNSVLAAIRYGVIHALAAWVTKGKAPSFRGATEMALMLALILARRGPCYWLFLGHLLGNRIFLRRFPSKWPWTGFVSGKTQSELHLIYCF